MIKRSSINKDYVGQIMVLPFLITFLIFGIWPTVNTFRLSFTNTVLMNRDYSYTGFRNYYLILTDPTFLFALKNTLKIWILNFIPQMGAALLFSVWFSSKRLNLKGIGVFYKESIGIGFTHPHFGEILQSFKETIEAAGYELIFFNNNYSNSRFSYVEHCQFRNVDGVLIVDGSIPPREAADMESNGYKCVSLENYYTDIPTIISNNTAGTIQALNYLYTLGHRKIAMIAELDSNSNKERFKAYKTFLKQKHIPYRENLVTFCDGYSFEAYKAATDKLLDQSLGDFPTGIFTTFDHIALSVQKALLKRGYKIPNDISVIGFDDICMAKSVTPPLTTIRQNRSGIGVRAAEILLQRLINDDEVNHTKVTRIQTGLVVRNSTGSAKK